MLSLLSSPPPALTSAELAVLSQSTPATFEGIAPILRHKEEAVEFSIEPSFQGFTAETGTLYVTEGALSFFSTTSSSGLSIPYPHITLHAISRAPLRPLSTATGETTTQGGGPCIYCQIDEAEGQDDEGETRELIIVPSDPTALDKIFEMLSVCAALHPPTNTDDSNGMFGLDPDSMVYADAEGNLAGPGMIEQMTAEEEANGSAGAGRAALEYLESIMMGPGMPKTNGKSNGVAK